MTAQADYSWRLLWLTYADGDVPVLLIEDLDKGRRSVTNDIEEVLKEIQAELIDQSREENSEPLILAKFGVMYKDSDGAWDEVVVQYPFHFRGFVMLPRDRELDELMREVAGRHAYRTREHNRPPS